ncbi:MAG: acylneuraminate cytidylyltransferase family protein [Elusimicrobia bacterium]|nr:acylneuraminate cytidylyltransferase family protein [Elusimicrobiota bacterium]
MKPSVLALIPARGGSKSVPRKNIKPIAGKPLIAWTIEQAEAAETISRVVVSTEDAEIARIARRYGAEVLDRPAALAKDDTDTLDVMQHAVRELRPDVLVLLQCTSPIRRPGLIDRCVKRFLAEKADSLATVFPDHSYEYGVEMPRRQDIKPRLIDTGNIYIMRCDLLRKGDRYGRKIVRVETSREEAAEIDEPFDFWLAEKILLERPPETWQNPTS